MAETNQNSFMIIAIVGIVAVVGIVALVLYTTNVVTNSGAATDNTVSVDSTSKLLELSDEQMQNLVGASWCQGFAEDCAIYHKIFGPKTCAKYGMFCI